MTKFSNGPAAGQNLSLKRAPRFLRVTKTLENGQPKFDALDQLEDSPRPNEELFAYVQTEHFGMCHINRGRHGSGFFAMATYALVEAQPEDCHMRGLLAWQTWCLKQPIAL